MDYRIEVDMDVSPRPPALYSMQTADGTEVPLVLVAPWNARAVRPEGDRSRLVGWMLT